MLGFSKLFFPIVVLSCVVCVAQDDFPTRSFDDTVNPDIATRPAIAAQSVPAGTDSIQPTKVTFIDHFVFYEIGEFGREVFDIRNWESLLRTFQAAFFENLFATVLVMMGFLFGIICYQRLLYFSDRTVKHALRDEYISSYNVSRLYAAAICLALICWAPLLVVGCYLRWNSASALAPDFQQSLGNGLIAIYIVAVTFRLLQEFFSTGGLSEAIYGVKYSTARYVLNRLEMSVLFAAPLIFLVVFSSSFFDGRWYGSVGRFSFLIFAGILFSQFNQLFWPGSKLYARLLVDDAVSKSAWVRHRYALYVLGVALFMLAAGLTISGWFELAKSLSINIALTMLTGVVVFSVRTIVAQKTNEVFRQSHLIEDLGRSADNADTARNRHVQDFVFRHSASAIRAINFLATAGFLAGSYWIWRNWITLPPELLNIQIAGVALVGLVAIAKLAGIGFVTTYLVRELPPFVVWLFSQQTKSTIANPELAKKLIAAVIVLAGLGVSARTFSLELPVIPWLGTLLTISLLLAARQWISDGFAGLVLLFDPRIKPGDSVDLDSRFGRVEAVNLFSTIVEDNLGTRSIVPNSIVMSSAIVKTRDAETVPMLIDVTLPRDSDAYQAQAIMMLVAEREPDVVSQPPPHVRFVAFRQHELRFQIRLLVLSTVDFEATRNRIEEKLVLEFERHEVASQLSRQDSVSLPQTRAG